MILDLSGMIGKKKSLAELLRLSASLTDDHWYIEDHRGQVAFGQARGDEAYEQPVWAGETIVGRVKGNTAKTVQWVGALLENWLQQEADKKNLGAETLHLYREINLLFAFSEKLSHTLGAADIASLTLNEVRQVIAFEAGVVCYQEENTGVTEILAAWPESTDLLPPPDWIQAGQSKIISLTDRPGQMLLLAVFRLGARVAGSILLRGPQFVAADLKILSTLAAQAGAAIEQARRQAMEQERLLKAQREQLMMSLALKNPFFKKLMAIAEKHCTDTGFSVAVLAQQMHLSTSQLQRKTATLTDLTPVQIIRDLRLARAKSLLLEQDLTVSEVAFQAGFNDPSYFTRLFVREMGCAPSVWKVRHLS